MGGERTVKVLVEPDMYEKLVGRAAADDVTMQNVVLAACREFVGERQRNTVGRGRRSETIRGGPDSGTAQDRGPRTLDLRIGRKTHDSLVATADDRGCGVHDVVVLALEAWLDRR